MASISKMASWWKNPLLIYTRRKPKDDRNRKIKAYLLGGLK
jgi:hypothetical protein